MNLLHQALEAAQKKRDLFLRYEGETEALLTCELDDIPRHVDLREELRVQVDALDSGLFAVLEEGEEGALIKAAYQNRCDFAALPTHLQPVFAAAQETFGIISRIRRLEPQAVARMEEEKKNLLELIRRNNQDVGAKAAKFYGGTGADTGSRLSGRNTRI